MGSKVKIKTNRNITCRGGRTEWVVKYWNRNLCQHLTFYSDSGSGFFACQFQYVNLPILLAIHTYSVTSVITEFLVAVLHCELKRV